MCICPISIIVYCGCVYLSNYVFSYLCIFVSYLCISTVAGGAVCICPISIIQGLLDLPMWGSTPPVAILTQKTSEQW